jgi:hypothetical protein
MRSRVSLGTLLMLSLIGLFPSWATAECGLGDSGICDTVRIGCPIRVAAVIPGDSIMVPIYLWNDEELGGFTVGFKFDSTILEIVSKNTYDTTGSIIPFQARSFIKEKISIPGRYLIGWADIGSDPPYNPIPVNTTNNARLLITINFKIKSTATPTTIVIDSAYVPPAGRFVLASESGYSIYPQYVHCLDGDIILGGISCGDMNGSGDINIADIVFMVNYIFRLGPPPHDPRKGDIDCDLRVTIGDVVYLINYVFKGGPEPCLGCE